MLISDTFVILNQPKTGSSFVREAIKEIHNAKVRTNWKSKILKKLNLKKDPFLKELYFPNLTNSKTKNQHGRYFQIPIEHLSKTIATVVRNPYDRLLSIYEYRFWVKHPYIEESKLYEVFPHFPDITLDEFLKLREIRKMEKYGSNPLINLIGFQTITFIEMFFKDPMIILNSLKQDYLDNNSFQKDMPKITFLKQENLKEELIIFLSKMGYSNHELDFLKSKPKVNVTINKTKDRKSLWTPNALKYVEEKEQLVFKILALHGIYYKKPELNL